MQSPTQPLIDKQQFVGLDRYTWLYTGAESPPHRGVAAAMNEYVEKRSLGPGGRAYDFQIEQSCRGKLAALMGATPEQIAFLSNASEAIAAVVQSVGMKAGDNVVLHTLEYPSAVFSCLALQSEGVEVRVVPHQNWNLAANDILSRVDANTKLVITSHVSYLSGARMDYEAIYRRLRETDALLLLDATQSLGVIPVDLAATDFIVSSSYKWLLGIHGIGVLGINPQRTEQLMPRSVGWRSVPDLFAPDRHTTFHRHTDARRFELGYPGFATIAALDFSTQLLLDLGIERIERHVLNLGTELLEAMHRLGLQVMTPREPAQRAGNVAFVCAEGEKLAEALAKDNVLTWGGDGRLRASVHLYNDRGDIDRFIAAVARHRQLI